MGHVVTVCRPRASQSGLGCGRGRGGRPGRPVAAAAAAADSTNNLAGVCDRDEGADAVVAVRNNLAGVCDRDEGADANGLVESLVESLVDGLLGVFLGICDDGVRADSILLSVSVRAEAVRLEGTGGSTERHAAWTSSATADPHLDNRLPTTEPASQDGVQASRAHRSAANDAAFSACLPRCAV
jgi:hypothetical protein